MKAESGTARAVRVTFIGRGAADNPRCRFERHGFSLRRRSQLDTMWFNPSATAGQSSLFWEQGACRQRVLRVDR